MKRKWPNRGTALVDTLCGALLRKDHLNFPYNYGHKCSPFLMPAYTSYTTIYFATSDQKSHSRSGNTTRASQRVIPCYSHPTRTLWRTATLNTYGNRCNLIEKNWQFIPTLQCQNTFHTASSTYAPSATCGLPEISETTCHLLIRSPNSMQEIKAVEPFFMRR